MQTNTLRTMPFGKYKGQVLADIELDYLKWLADKDDLREPLASALKSELRKREILESVTPSEAADLQKVATAIIEAGAQHWREKLHDDADRVELVRKGENRLYALLGDGK